MPKCKFFLDDYLSSQLNFFSGVSNLQNSFYWWSIFSLFAAITRPENDEKSLFPVCLLSIYRNSFNIIMWLINPQCAWKNSQTNKKYSIKLLQLSIFYPTAKFQNHKAKTTIYSLGQSFIGGNLVPLLPPTWRICEYSIILPHSLLHPIRKKKTTWPQQVIEVMVNWKKGLYVTCCGKRDQPR